MGWSHEISLSGVGFPRFINTTLGLDSNVY
ncbi:MAG: hypothetical protein ACJAS0_002366 [Alcanivorax borkumensis]|jgi:hypothetical protein